jgi:hypothetical protein
MGKSNNRTKYVAKPVAAKVAPETNGAPRKLSKQEKRNQRKQEKRIADAGQCVSGANDTRKDLSAVHATTDQNVGCSVYKRIPVYPRSYPMSASSAASQGFVEPHNKNFKKILETCYQGFVLQNADSFTREFHDKFQGALKGLEGLHFYQFDLTQPAGLGTKVAKTFVTRCVVGEPGVTYKYLGLRMFGFPWVVGATGSNPFTVAIGEMNDELIRRANELNQASGKDQVGSSNFNLTLINRCYPEGEEILLKNEPMFEKDKMTVSWHADSCLDHYSAIAVYHFNEITPGKIEKPWRAALRVQVNAEGPQQGKPVPDLVVDCPAVAMPLPKECCYYMLDDFNHHHQHAGESSQMLNLEFMFVSF